MSPGLESSSPDQNVPSKKTQSTPSRAWRTDRLGRVARDRMGLAQRKDSEAVVEVSVREHDRLDRRMAGVPGVKRGEALDLRADLGRGVQQEPPVAAGAHREGVLGTRRRPDRALPD